MKRIYRGLILLCERGRRDPLLEATIIGLPLTLIVGTDYICWSVSTRGRWILAGERMRTRRARTGTSAAIR